LSGVKKRIKFQTFSQAWGRKEAKAPIKLAELSMKSTSTLVREPEIEPAVLRVVPVPNVVPVIAKEEPITKIEEQDK